MTYISGTITDANPGPAWYAVIEPALTSAGFVLQDTVVISTRTHKIWKSAAASNSQNKDWYLDVAYTTTNNGTMFFGVSEGYVPGTDSYLRPTFSGASSTIEATYNSRWGATEVTLENASQVPRAGNADAQNISITNVAFGYWMSITTNRVGLIMSSDPTMVHYYGLLNPIEPYKTKVGAQIYPLISGKFSPSELSQSNSAAIGTLAVARSPLRTAALSGNNWNITAVTEPLELAWTPSIPSGNTQYQDRVAAPVYHRFNQYGTDNPTGFSATFYDLYVVPATTTVRGDTLTLSGTAEPFILTTANNGRSLMVRAF